MIQNNTERGKSKFLKKSSTPPPFEKHKENIKNPKKSPLLWRFFCDIVREIT